MELRGLDSETSRVDEIDREVFQRISVRGRGAYLSEELGEILDESPELSRDEVAELGDRLRQEGYLTPTDTNKSLACLAIVAQRRDDRCTIKSIRNHFLSRFNLIGAGLAWLEERKVPASSTPE